MIHYTLMYTHLSISMYYLYLCITYIYVYIIIVNCCSTRAGGYCRVLRAGYRRGDNAPMAVLEYVDREGEMRIARPGTATIVDVDDIEISAEEKLVQVMEKQAKIKDILKNNVTNLPDTLVPGFPTPHLTTSSWDEITVPSSTKNRRGPRVFSWRKDRIRGTGAAIDVTDSINNSNKKDKQPEMI